MSPKKWKKPAEPVQATTDVTAKRGACLACRSRKVRCDFTPGAIACRKCIAGGHSEDCTIQESCTHSRGNSAPPLDLSQSTTGPGKNWRGSHSQIQRSTTTTPGSEFVHQSRPPPSTDSARSSKRQRSSSSLPKPACSVNLVSVPEVDESILPDELESLPPPLSEFYDHFAILEDDHMDNAGTNSDTNSDAKEFLSYVHHGDDNEPEPSGVESGDEDRNLNADDESESDDELLATLQSRLSSTKPQVKRMPVRQMSKGKGRCTPAIMPAGSNDLDHPKTCVFKIQCCIQRSQGSKVSSIPFTILSSISLEDLREMVAEKLNRHARRVQLQYRLESDKAKALFISIQSDEELEMFKDRMRPLIVPQYLPSGNLSTRPLKPIHVIFEDSGDDEPVDPPVRVSTTNTHKAGTKGIAKNVGSSSKQTRTPSNNELDGADVQQNHIEALHERYRCNTHSKGPESPVYCYRANNSTDCYALTHNHIATWSLQIMQKNATVDEKPHSLLSLTKRSKSKDEVEAASGHVMQPAPATAPVPAPYAYPPPPVIVVPPAAPWGMHHGYPGHLPQAPLGSLLPAHTTTRHTSHPATPSLLTADLPNENLPQETVPFPDIIRWFSFLDQRVRRNPCVNVSVNFSAFGPVLQAKGFLDIAQLSGNYVSVENLQAWLGVEVGTALVIRSYADLDIQAVNAGKYVLPTDN